MQTNVPMPACSALASEISCLWRIPMFQKNQQVGNLVAIDVATYPEPDEGVSATSSPRSDRRRPAARSRWRKGPRGRELAHQAAAPHPQPVPTAPSESDATRPHPARLMVPISSTRPIPKSRGGPPSGDTARVSPVPGRSQAPFAVLLLVTWETRTQGTIAGARPCDRGAQVPQSKFRLPGDWAHHREDLRRRRD